MAATKLATIQPLPFQLSLRIRHPSMDPADISKELRIEPEHSFRAGQRRRPSRSGIAPGAVHSESYWLGALNPGTWFQNPSIADPHNFHVSRKSIEAAAAWTLPWALSLCAVRFNKSHGALLQSLRSTGGEISLLVTLEPNCVTSFSLPPEVSRIFGELGITLEFDITTD
jgi:hypothetical protein